MVLLFKKEKRVNKFQNIMVKRFPSIVIFYPLLVYSVSPARKSNKCISLSQI